MTDDENDLRAAINSLPDNIEIGQMPSSRALAADAKALHERATDDLENMLRLLAAYDEDIRPGGAG